MTDKSQLRLALGMRGGVSLAVWIGGACAEIDELRRANEPAEAAEPFTGAGRAFWSELLGLSQYSEVIVDILAGASAGGLNGVLYAASQAYEFDLRRMRKLWLDVADLDLMERQVSKRKEIGEFPSLLDGDGRFLDPVHDALVELIGGPERDGVARVDLQLSATLVEPIDRPLPSLDREQQHQKRFAARFHFAHQTEVPWLPSDLPRPPDAALWMLALAARSTASFPVAFEGALVRSTRAERFGSREVPAQGHFTDMGGVFSERRGTAAISAELEPSDFVLADGGILDNIPLGKAIQAIIDAPADQPTARYLVYVQPGVPGAGHSEATPKGAARRSSVAVLQAVFGGRSTSEGISDDIAALEQHNVAVARAASLRRATFADIGRRAAAAATGISCRQVMCDLAEDQWEAYRILRADADASLVETLLLDPRGALGEDPFPSSVAAEGGGRQKVEDQRWLSPVAGWSEARREDLAAALGVAFLGRTATAAQPIPIEQALLVGVRPLARVTQLLIEWARHLEPHSAGDASAIKGQLYRLLLFARRLDQQRRLAWVVTAACSPETGPTDTGDWAEESLARVDRLLHPANPTAAQLAEAVRGNDGAPVIGYLSWADDILDDLMVSARSVGGGDLRDGLVGELASLAGELAAVARGAPRADPPVSTPAGWLDEVLRDGDEPFDARTLAALEIVTLPEFHAGRPGVSPIQYRRMASDNRTPIACSFEKLMAKAEEHQMAKGACSIDPMLKLAGNELFNFSAFLRSEWRANDWLWGRLDAVPTLVDVLVTPASVRAVLSGLPPRDALDRLHEMVTRSALEPAQDWTKFLEKEVWNRYKAKIAEEYEGLQQPDQKLLALQDALVARRQWEILAEELAQSRTAPAPLVPAAPLAPSATRDEVRTYAVGAETLTRPKRIDNVETFDGLGRAAAVAIRWNAAQVQGDVPGGAFAPSVADRVSAVVWRGTPIATRLLLAPTGGLAPRLVKRPEFWLVLLAVVAFAYGAWAFASDWKVALGSLVLLIGVALALVAVGRLVNALWPPRRRRRRRAKGDAAGSASA